MTKERFNTCLLLWAGHEVDVPRACREVGEFLRFRHSFPPHFHADQDWRLIGLWVDRLVETPFEFPYHFSALERHPFRLRETVGINGIWQLYWLESLLPWRPANQACALKSLVSCLIEERSSSRQSPTPQFAPVFDADDNRSFIGLQSERLKALFPG